ncbi:MAG: glycosyltransferase [Spirochaetaceae bacterium]|nr:MAG: glycosyltransferase [Spirochaetaceae bacterium]
MTILILALLFFVWLAPFLFLWSIPYPSQPGPLDTPGGSSPLSVSIIIPARNEETTLPILLQSLKAQDVNPIEVLVVDDHSEDATARIAARHDALVVPSAPLPKGWLGKPWACWQGARRAGGEIFLFLDADTCLEPGGLRKIVLSYLRHGGLVSIWPYHRMERLYERLSALFNIIIMASMGSFTIRGEREGSLGAFGPCVICSRRDYFSSGGHEGVRGAILEDVALGQLFTRAGFEIHNYGGKGAISFRMYPAGIGSLITGFTKGMASGARAAAPKILVPIICWITGGFIVSFWLLYLLLSWNLESAVPWIVLHILYVLQIFWILFRMGNYGFYSALLYPLAFMFFAAVFTVSLLRTFLKREVRWKGRKIDMER